MPFCLQAKLDLVNGHTDIQQPCRHQLDLHVAALMDLGSNAETPQRRHPVMQSNFGNSKAAVQLHTQLM